MALTTTRVRNNLATVRGALQAGRSRLSRGEVARHEATLDRAQGLTVPSSWRLWATEPTQRSLQTANGLILGVARAADLLDHLEIRGDAVVERQRAAVDHGASRFRDTHIAPDMRSVAIDIRGLGVQDDPVPAVRRSDTSFVQVGANRITIDVSRITGREPMTLTVARGGNRVTDLGPRHLLVQIESDSVSRRLDGQEGHATFRIDPTDTERLITVTSHSQTNRPLIDSERLDAGRSRTVRAKPQSDGRHRVEVWLGDIPVELVWPATRRRDEGEPAAASARRSTGRTGTGQQRPLSAELRWDDPLTRQPASFELPDPPLAGAAPLARRHATDLDSPHRPEARPPLAPGKVAALQRALSDVFGPEVGGVKVSERDNGDIAVEVLPREAGTPGRLRLSFPGDIAHDAIVSVCVGVGQQIRPFGTSARAHVDIDFFRRPDFDALAASGVILGDPAGLDYMHTHGMVAFSGPDGGGALTQTEAQLPRVDAHGVSGEWTAQNVRSCLSAPPGVTFSLPWPQEGHLYRHQQSWFYERDAAAAARLMVAEAVRRAQAHIGSIPKPSGPSMHNAAADARMQGIFSAARLPSSVVVYFPRADRPLNADNPYNQRERARPADPRIVGLLPPSAPARTR